MSVFINLTDEHLDDIHAVQCAAFVPELHESIEYFQSILARPHGCHFAYREGERIIAYLLSYPISQEAYQDNLNGVLNLSAGQDGLYLHDLCIHPDVQGRGVSRHMLTDLYRRINYPYIMGVSVQGTHDFWKKSGFTIKNPIDYNGEPGIVIEKKIKLRLSA